MSLFDGHRISKIFIFLIPKLRYMLIIFSIFILLGLLEHHKIQWFIFFINVVICMSSFYFYYFIIFSQYMEEEFVWHEWRHAMLATRCRRVCVQEYTKSNMESNMKLVTHWYTRVRCRSPRNLDKVEIKTLLKWTLVTKMFFIFSTKKDNICTIYGFSP